MPVWPATASCRMVPANFAESRPRPTPQANAAAEPITPSLRVFCFPRLRSPGWTGASNDISAQWDEGAGRCFCSARDEGDTDGGRAAPRPSFRRVIPSRDSEWPEGPWAAASRGLSSLLPRNPIVSFVGSAEAMGQACFQLPEGLGKGRGTSPCSGCSCKPCCRAWLFLSPSSPRTGALRQLGPCPTLRAEAARMGEIEAALEE
ncbi:hypothetical protein KIL84_016202 [Mauremys mutica]|uniref:Uncharacterized protein n=1 Tax=Mauremys mutica TaxID=74926 RepID=A0A9D3WU09_9SAUR|nr:hypothetical protein KIL84_016202 [Mauremys mutica]